MLTEFLERFFARHSKEKSSRAEAKRRLQIVVAHDRADLSPALVDQIRNEILAIVTRYVEIDPGESEFALEHDQRTSALIANLPIKRIKAEPVSSEPEPAATATTEAPSDPLELSIESVELLSDEPVGEQDAAANRVSANNLEG